MKRWREKNKLNFLSLLPIIPIIGIFPISHNLKSNLQNLSRNNTIQKVNHNNNNNNHSASSIDKINSFKDYDAIVNTTTYQSISTKIGFLGKTKDSKTAILTSYGGAVVWSQNIASIKLVQDFYASKGITDISNYQINGWITTNAIENISKEYIAILFGTTDNKNQIVLFLDADTGEVFTPYSIVNPESPNSYVGNITYVGDGQTTLYKTGHWRVVALGGSTSKEVSTSIQIITLSNRSVSSIKPIIDSIGLNETDKFVGFTPGYASASSSVNFFQFKKTDNTIYTVAVDSNLNNILNSTNKVTVDLSTFTPTSSFTENNIVKYGFPIYTNANNNAPKFAYLVPGSSTKLHVVTYTKSNKTFSKIEFDISASKPNDVISNLIFNSTTNKLYFSLSSSDDSIITYIDVSATTLKYETLKSKGNTTITKPWLMTPVINSGTSTAFIAVINDNSLVKNYTKSDNTIAPETALTFTKYNDPVTSIKNDNNIYKYKLPSAVTQTDLNSHLRMTTSGYTITSNTLTPDNIKGTLKFNYNVQYLAWWQDNLTMAFTIPMFVDGFYTLSNVKLEFVVSENIDPNKYKKIEELKSTKPASSITKQDILNYFVTYDIIDKNGTKFTLGQSHITLESKDNDYALDVTIKLPASSFPTGYTNLTYTTTFKGFTKLEGYNAVIRKNNDSIIKPFKYKFPSEITFENVISSFIDFSSSGYSYHTNADDWDFESTYDDYLGTFKITKLYYKRTQDVPSFLPQSKRSLIGLNNQQTYSGFKNILSSFNKTPVLKSVSQSTAGTMTTLDAWHEWENAIKSGNRNEIVSTLLYSSVVFDLVKSPSDLVFTPLNLSVANQQKKLNFKIEIRENAPLNIKYKGADLIFSNEVKDNLISKNPNKDYYPFNVEWSIDYGKSYFQWNIPENNAGFSYSEDNGVERLTIDLDQQNWQLINRNMTVNQFLSNPLEYKTAIVQLFDYSDNYQIEFSEPISNSEQGIVTIRVDFVEKENNSFHDKQTSTNSTNNSLSNTKEIVITGFKLPTSKFTIAIPISIVAIILFGLSITTLYVFVITRRKMKVKRSFINKKAMKEKKNQKVVIVETPNINIPKPSIDIDQKNQNMIVNRLHGYRNKYKKR